ncbi:MAG: phage terminase large subunit [Pseudomonadota bacterium]
MTNSTIYQALYRNDLSSFINRSFYIVNPGVIYQHNWHIDVISDYLSDIYRGKLKRLIINMPPRYLKSIAVTIAWPAWLLGKNPSMKIMIASYSQILSTKHSLDSRIIMQSGWYHNIFPNVSLAHDQNEKNKFNTTKNGGRFATSVGGTVTGEGGDILILDDPHNPADIMSDKKRQTTLDWFDQVWLSRLNDKKNGAIILVMQRLHENDLTGHILAKNNKEWELLSLPAYFPKKTIINSPSNKFIISKNSYLHEKREGKNELSSLKNDLGSAIFNAQYLQKPHSIKTALVKREWLQRYNILPNRYIRIIQSWDTAYKTNKNSDYSVGVTIYETHNAFYIADIYRKKLAYNDLKLAIINQAEKFNPTSIIIEDKASGQSLIQELHKQTNLPIISSMPKDSKITRISNIIPFIESGKILLPNKANWLIDFEDELLSLPNSEHDDQVDSLAQAINWANDNKIMTMRIRDL